MTDESAQAPAWTFRSHWMSQAAGHAVMRPDATALRFLGADTTWRELHERSLRFAGALRQRGVEEGDRVILLTLNRPEFVEAVFAINSLGAIAVPVNARLTPPELVGLVEDSGSKVIITEELLAPLAAAVAALAPILTTRVVMGEADGMEAYESLVETGDPIELGDIAEDSVALIMYTSGTTGKPKGAMLTHHNMQMQALTCIRANDVGDESDIAFMTAPFFHIAGLGSLAANFVLGIPSVIHPLGAFDPAAVVDAWERERATVVFNVPQQWQAICALPGIKERDLALRIISWGAAPASETLLKAMADTFPNALNVAVFGQTETSPITCVLRGEESLRKLGSVGRPIPTIQYRIVDGEMNDVPTGEVGEIVYRGPTVTRGYWNNPEATAKAYVGGWFHSGDLVRQDEEGFVWVVDRAKDMIISGGENIYSAEVENAIHAHPAVLEAAVIGRSDERWGEVPVAYVVTAPEESIDLEGLNDFLTTRLARFKLPKDLVLLDALPRNAGGKVRKTELRS
ncbi:fatty-acyl-CoA synthase [Nocardioides albertanoniae]|uniref:Fatty-acyl-CoA synthase n=1 Tax=Nocardioides albertanoniae TaxID=1175486 RepID=A0A543A870_9ACTN|nr:long-chain-fatty-acid--CoA ligase [Nocardioides albertanoniae]TQL68802.1 fatty-acyl-CoA synthase [Nocardioides albertanoniae]